MGGIAVPKHMGMHLLYNASLPGHGLYRPLHAPLAVAAIKAFVLGIARTFKQILPGMFYVEIGLDAAY